MTAVMTVSGLFGGVVYGSIVRRFGRQVMMIIIMFIIIIIMLFMMIIILVGGAVR